MIGVDYQVAQNTLIGLAIGGSGASFNANTYATSGNLTGFHLGVYGAHTIGDNYLTLSETFSAYSNQTTRKAGGFGTIGSETLTANFSSTEWRTRLEGGHSFKLGDARVVPLFVGLRLANNVNFDNGWRLGLVGSLAYVHEFMPNANFNNYLVGLPGADFSVIGPRADSNLLQAKFGGQLNFTQSVAVFASVQGEFAANATSYAATAGFKYNW